MKIKLEGAAKRYGREWVFKNLDTEFSSPNSYAIVGPNGSGKSTLIKVLSGFLSLTQGKIAFENNGKVVRGDEVYERITFAAPYISLIEEFTLDEVIRFQASFKKIIPGMNENGIISLLGMEKQKDKLLRDYSSGMKQRVKLALALFFESKILLLDEPTTNLDAAGIGWYREMIDIQKYERLVIIGSNQEHDFDFCKTRLNVTDFKQQTLYSASN